MKQIKTIKLYTLIIIALALCMVSFTAAYADSDESVTIYLTVSDDGDFVTGCDGTVLASTPLKVDYFDLAEYGLERYTYDKAEEEETPTLLHAYIRATEKYYLGRRMTADDFDYREKALWVTNSPGSLYLKAFWGHDENLLYHFNHEYPYQEGSTSIGATCDEIIVSDGDIVDIAMFTEWGISSTGAFAFFSDDRLQAGTGEIIEITGCSTAGMLAGTDVYKHVMENEQLRISKDGGRTWIKGIAKTDDGGIALLRFLEPGTYYVSAGPRYMLYEDAVGAEYPCVAPPICIVEVRGDPVAYELYEVVFETGSGSPVDTQSVRWYGAAERPDDPIRNGYDFTGWYTDLECKNAYDFDMAVRSDLTLYAGWEETEAHAEERKKKEHEAAVRKATIKKAKAARTIVSVKALKKHKAKIIWKKVTLSYTVDGKKYTRAVTGYKVYRTTKKASKYKLIKTIKKAGTLKYTDKKLKKGKQYYYKVRTYIKIEGKTYLGKWSKARQIRVK